MHGPPGAVRSLCPKLPGRWALRTTKAAIKAARGAANTNCSISKAPAPPASRPSPPGGLRPALTPAPTATPSAPPAAPSEENPGATP